MSPYSQFTDLLPKVVNYRFARSGFLNPGPPINITLSITNMCQSRCKTCNIYQLYKNGQGRSGCGIKDEMTTAEFEKLFDALGHVYFVNMSGGEPYLRPDFPMIVEMANTLLTPSVIHTPTNALMPERIEEMTEDILQRIERSGRQVTFTVKPSFDGVGEQHDEIRGVPGNFERLLDTLDRLRRLKERYSNLEVGAGTVISKFNFDSVRSIASYVHQLELDSYISEIAEQRSEMFNFDDPITPSADEYAEAMAVFGAESRKHLGRSGKLGKMTGAFRLVYYDLVVRILREQRQVLPCYGGISNVHISPYGDVWPCCILGYEYSFGRLRDHDYNFYKLWHSARASEVREHIRDGRCWCPLANQAYSNILCSPAAMLQVIRNMLRTTGRHTETPQLSEKQRLTA